MAARPAKADRTARSPDGVRLAFEGGTGYLLSRAGSAARRRWARMLAERALTPHHYGMLMTLHEHGPSGQQRLSELIGIDPRNAVPVVDALAERDLLVRGVDPTDRRRRVLTLTESGRDMVHELTETGAEIEADFLRALDPADQKELHRMLLTLLASSTQSDADG